MVAQQVAEESDRSIKLSRTNTMTSTEFTVGATDRANKVLSFDASGEIAVAQELGTFKGDSATTTTAAYVVRDIVKGTTAAQLNNIYICIQASPIGTALTNTSYWVLIVDAVSAATSATSAASSATDSANSATASASSATTSGNSATASANSATASANSATSSASSATDAAASFDSFDDRYLGAKSSAPTVDNDGNALLTGALYFNSTSSQIFNWTSSAWEAIKPTSTEQTAINAAATNATNAANSATAAASSASTASTQASNASSSASTASTQASNASTSAAEAAASADAFDDIYLGTKSSDPTVDNDGNALAAGMLYFNSTNNILRVYSGSAWQDAAISATGVVTLTGTQILTNKTLTAPVINSPTGNFLKIEGTDFTNSLLVGHATTGTLNNATHNTGVGINALVSLTTGDKNTSIGSTSFNGLATGQSNTAIGHQAGSYTSDMTQGVCIGAAAGRGSSGTGNIGIGKDANRDVTGNYNISLGYESADNLTSGDGNVFIGTGNIGSATGDRQLIINGYDGTNTTTWISGDSSGNVTVAGTLTTSSGVVAAQADVTALAIALG
jgi:hypothetical protein